LSYPILVWFINVLIKKGLVFIDFLAHQLFEPRSIELQEVLNLTQVDIKREAFPQFLPAGGL
jgi:hypothetical protein